MSLEHRHHNRCACGSSLSGFTSEYTSSRPFALSGVKRVYERSRPFTIQHIALDLELLVQEKAIAATAVLDVVRIDPAARELSLDAVGFAISSVAVHDPASGRGKRGARGWQDAAYCYDGETLRIAVAPRVDRARVRVVYRAAPRRGLYFLAPDEHVKDRPWQVWTQCQDEDARHVFPCHDKPHVKQTTELRVKVPAGWFALSNGKLVGDEKVRKEGGFHWVMDDPHPSYLVTLVAGEFAELVDDAGGIPVTYYVPKGREFDGRRAFARTPEMIRLFGQLTGVAYPWNKYAQIVVTDFIFGGMENTTATTMYEHILLDERAAIDITSDDLVAHELAHQWFGDYVTCRDWSHAWLNEGFATFMEHVDRKAHLGQDEYEHGLGVDLEAYLAEARGRYRRPVVCQDYETPIDIFDRHLYEKGALVLHMLHCELGHDTFWKGVGHYLTRHARGVVETRDLMRAFEDVSGRGLEQFFEQWIYRAGHPELEVTVAHEDGALSVQVKQTQTSERSVAHSATAEPTTLTFSFDLTFDIGTARGVRREVRRVDQRTHTFVFPMRERPALVVIDADLRVIGELRVEAPADLLRAQLLGAPTARGRALAAAALGRHDDPVTTKTLASSLADERESWATRAEVAEALGKIRSSEAFEALARNRDTKHAKVRRAIVAALGKFRTAKAAEILQPLALSDASYLVESEAARSLGSTRQAVAFDTLVEILDRPSWADVVRAGAIDGLAALRDDRAVPHIAARTRYGVNARGRRAAILALPRLSSDRKTRETLEDLLESTDPHLRVDVVRALGELGDGKARGALLRQLDRELDGRVRRRIREVLRDLGGGRRDAERMRDELEALRCEHAELRARVGALEALVLPSRDKRRGAKGRASRPS